MKSTHKALNDSLEGFKRQMNDNQDTINSLQEGLVDKADRVEVKNQAKETDRKLSIVALEYKKIYDKLDGSERDQKKNVMVFKKEIRDRMANFLKSHKEDEDKMRDQIDELVKAQNDFKALNELQLNETVKYIQNINEKSASESSATMTELKRQVTSLSDGLRTLDTQKVNFDHFEEFTKDVNKALKDKCSVKENKLTNERFKESLQAEFAALREELDGIVNNFRKEIKQLLKKKVDAKSYAAHVDECALKKEHLEVKGMFFSRLEDTNKRVAMAERQLIETSDLHKYIRKIEDYDKHMEKMQLKLDKLDPLKKISKLIADKTSFEDVNKVAMRLSESISQKVDKTEIKAVLDEQSQFNEFFCTESVIARYKWRSGALSDRSLIPWEIEVVNTLKDNFYWTEGGSHVTIANGGLYEVKFGVFGLKKSQLKLLLNDQIVLALAGHKETEKDKPATTKDPAKVAVTGTTFIDYFILPGASKLSVKCIGGVVAEGFLDIKRL